MSVLANASAVTGDVEELCNSPLAASAVPLNDAYNGLCVVPKFLFVTLTPVLIDEKPSIDCIGVNESADTISIAFPLT